MNASSAALGVATAGVAGAALAIGVYDFLSGRKLLLDLRDKRRLRRRPLEAWDEHWARNPRESEIVVCLTTTPSRIERLGDALASLLAQSVRPRRIRLHLPEFSRREGRPYELPPWLEKLRGVQVVRCEDFGPATKLLPALLDLPADQPILVVDDDMLYPPDMLQAFEARAAAEGDVAHALSGWIVPPDLTDRPTTLLGNLLQRPPVPSKCSRLRRPRRVDVLQGYAGFLVRPRFFDSAEVCDYSGAPPQATWVDDVWLSGHCRVPKYVFPYRRYPCSFRRNARLFSASSLGRRNRGPGGPEERANTIVLRHLRDRWMISAGGGDAR